MGLKICGSIMVMGGVDSIPVVVGKTSTEVPWEWGLPLPEWYIISGAQSTLMFLYRLK